MTLNRIALLATLHCLTGCAIGIPGAMDAGLDDVIFWGSLAFSLVAAFVAAFPVNRYLIARGRGQAGVHGHHHEHHHAH